MSKGSSASFGAATCSLCGFRSKNITVFVKTDDGLVCRDERTCKDRSADLTDRSQSV